MRMLLNIINLFFLIILFFNLAESGIKKFIHSSPLNSKEIASSQTFIRSLSNDFLTHRSFPTNKSYLTESERHKLLNGIQIISKIEKYFSEKNFVNTVELIDEITDQIFNVSSSTIFAIFLTGEISSSEIELYKKALSQLNNVINQWSEGFNEVKYSMDWAAININFADIENRIVTVQRLLTRFTKFTKDENEFSAKQFLHSFEVDYKASGDLLYSIMININQSFSENLFRASQKFSQFYRHQVQIFMVTMTQLLVQAMNIEANFVNLKYEQEDAAIFLKSIWKERFNLLKSAIETIDLDTKDQFKNQYQIDLDEYLMTRESLTNEQFNRVIYNFLSAKYDWRDWFVVVYAPISGFKDHTVSTCQGTHRFRQNGRNIIVSSVDKIDVIAALSHIERNKQLIGSYTEWKSDREYSRGWVSHIGKLIPNCNDADTRVSIAWGSNVWYMNTKLVVYKKNCVNDKSPCYNTFLFA